MKGSLCASLITIFNFIYFWVHRRRVLRRHGGTVGRDASPDVFVFAQQFVIHTVL